MNLNFKHVKPAILAGLIFAAPFATAHDGAKGVVKQRMDAMGKIGTHLKAVNAMLRGTTELDENMIQSAMDEVSMFARHLPDMFPKGSDAAPSEAGPKIWTQNQEFNTLFSDLGSAAQDLSQAATTGDNAEMRAAFAALAKTCKGCHAEYRINRD